MNFIVYLFLWVILSEGIEVFKLNLSLVFFVYGNLMGIERLIDRFFIIFYLLFWRFFQEIYGYIVRGINYFGMFVFLYDNDFFIILNNYQFNFFYELGYEWFGYYVGFGFFVEILIQFFMFEVYFCLVFQDYFYDYYMDEVEK